MNNLKDKILTQIKEGDIQPTSRWYFVTKNYFFWALTAVSALVGAFAVASLLHQIVLENFRPMSEFASDPGFTVLLFKNLPYVWIILVIVLAVAAWYNYKNTDYSYKYQNSTVVMVVLLASFVFGFTLFATGAGKHINEQAREKLPYMQHRFENAQKARQEFRELRQSLREQGIELPKPQFREGSARIFQNR